MKEKRELYRILWKGRTMNQKKERWFRVRLPMTFAVICLFVLMSCNGFCSLIHTVQAASTFTVTFKENNGKSTEAMKKLNLTKIKKGTKVTLPKVPFKNGYYSPGWTTKKGSNVMTSKAGKHVPITFSKVYYAIRYRRYTVTYCDAAGKTESTKKSYDTAVITLPKVPALSGYRNLGWTTKRGSTTPLYKAGSSFTVKKNVKLYPVREKIINYKVAFYGPNGESDAEYAALAKTVEKGTVIELPEVGNPSGYTFLGWSTTMGSKKPSLLAGASYTVSRVQKLYAVMYPISSERKLGTGDLPSGWQQTYYRVIFVGDSRTNRMMKTLGNQFIDEPALQSIEWVCEDGKTLDWLKNEGTTKLKNILKKGFNLKKKTAVIFNLGVNDLSKASGYVTYMKTLAQELSTQNCKLFYMSVNPVNHVMLYRSRDDKTSTAVTGRTAAKVLAFNAKIKSQLCTGGDYTYLDMYNYLIQNGFSFNSSSEGFDVTTGITDDGLHYSTSTYKRIFSQCLIWLGANS